MAPMQVSSTTTPLEPTPIPQVQGGGAASPYVGKTISVSGVVTGIQRTGGLAGFYLQDSKGDGDAQTSDALYVRIPETAGNWQDEVAIGSRATATGIVSERGGLTAVEVAARAGLKIQDRPGIVGLEPETLDVPVDAAKRVNYLESHEGMLVTMGDALVVGPTNAYGQYVAVDAAKHGARRMGSTPDTTGFIHVNGKLGPKPQLMVGDRVTGLKGPLGISNNTYEVLPTGNYKELHRGPQPPKSFGDFDGDDRYTEKDRAALTSRLGETAAGPLDPADLNGDGTISRADLNRFEARAARITGAPTIRIATINAENFFDFDDAPPPIDDDVPSANEYRTKLAKLAGTVRDRLGAPDVLAMQEVENTRVLDDLLARPELKGLGYRYVTLPTNGRRSINPVLLYRGDVEVTGAHQWQRSAPTGEESVWRPVSAPKPTEEEPLFAREPLVVDLKVTPKQGGDPVDLTVVVNHLISKYSPHGLPTEPLRVEQAMFLRESVDKLRGEHPEREVIVLGDMNDTPDSKALKALVGTKREPTLVNASATLVPEAERYSFIYDGKSELIDHITVTPGLVDRIERAGVRHGNADLPVGEAWDSSPARGSDHDSPSIDVRLGAAATAPPKQA
jgi:predicted extracellular nuclease